MRVFEYLFDVTSEVFRCWDERHDFAVLELPRSAFTMARIPVYLGGLQQTMMIHAFGHIGYSGSFNITGGEVSSFIPHGFSMNLLSALGYSGAAILADGVGRAVGYIGGNWDSSKGNNSQHQAYWYKFDIAVESTGRQATPTSSPFSKDKLEVSKELRSLTHITQYTVIELDKVSGLMSGLRVACVVGCHGFEVINNEFTEKGQFGSEMD
eukprot:gene31465-38031_t